jgi:hypothetical protein
MPREGGASKYAAAIIAIENPVFTGSPAFAGDDSEICGHIEE